MSDEVIASLISSLVGGLLVAIVNYLLTRGKTNAEIDKLHAEAEKMRVEAKQMQKNTDEIASYVVKEEMIYDGRKGITGYDLLVIKKDRANHHAFKQDMLIIERTQKQGIYQFQLRKYQYKDEDSEFLPKNSLVADKRKLKAAFEARVSEGARTIVFAMTSFPSEDLLDKEEIVIDEQHWREYNIFFRIPSFKDCTLQIVDLYGSEPGVLRLRDLTLEERLPKF
jgi:hypothetical protein